MMDTSKQTHIQRASSVNTFTYVALYSSIAVYSESGLYIIMLTTQPIIIVLKYMKNRKHFVIVCK